MVLYFEVLEGILRDHCALMEIIYEACKRWKVVSPVSSRQMGKARDSLEEVRGILREGIREVDIGKKRG